MYGQHPGGPGTPVEVYVHEGKGGSVTVNVTEGMTVDDVLTVAAIKEGLSPVEHFVRIKKRKDMSTNKYFVPQKTDLLETYLQTHEVVEVCAKILYQVRCCLEVELP